MATITADEVTVISRENLGKGYGNQILLEVYIEPASAFSASDSIPADALGVEAILGILGATSVNASNIVQSYSPGTTALILTSAARTRVGNDIGNLGLTLTGAIADSITTGSAFNAHKGLYMTLLVKTAP